jgi:hypothetical protein
MVEEPGSSQAPPPEAAHAEEPAPAQSRADGDDADKPLSVDIIDKATASGSGDPKSDKEGGDAHKKKPQKALTNEDVIKLVKAELGDKVIINKIRSSPGDKLDTSTDALIKLKKAGVSKDVIAAMIERADQ